MRVRQENFSPTRALARQFALCRKCPRGFEGPVVLLWRDIPVCQSCYIKELEAWNTELNKIHGQQTKAVMAVEGRQALNVGDMTYPEASSLNEHKTADTSQGVGALSTTPETSRPGIQSPHTKAEGQGIKSVGDGKKGGVDSKRDINLSLVTVDIQSQDCHNRKAGEVRA